MADDKAFEEGKTVFNNKVMGQETPDLEKAKYADAPFVDEGKKLEDVRKKFAPNADKSTTASAKKGEKSLPKVVKEVDQESKSQQMPELYKNSDQIMQLMSMGSGLLGMLSGLFNQNGGGGGMGMNFSVPSGTAMILNDSITGAFAILTRKYGFEKVIRNFTGAINYGGLNEVHPAWRPYLVNALSNLIKLGLYYGPFAIPVSQYGQTIYGIKIPSPLVYDLDLVPDYYLKQYYTLDNDPYPGYQQWLSPDGTTSIWTEKQKGGYHFNSASEEIYSISERTLAEDWDPYISDILINPSIINWALARQVDDIQNNSMENMMGNNTSGGGNTNNMMSMLMGMFGGMIGQLLQALEQGLQGDGEDDQPAVGSMEETLQKFKKDMAVNEQILQLTSSAVGGGGIGGLGMGGLGGLGGISGILGGFAGGGLEGILGGGLLGGIGNFGGGSGGGGGGAGSGFTGGFSDYSGGDVSVQGLSDIETLLRLLGLEENGQETQ